MRKIYSSKQQNFIVNISNLQSDQGTGGQDGYEYEQS